MRKLLFSCQPVQINLDEYRATLSYTGIERPKNDFYHGNAAIERQWHPPFTFTGFHEGLANQVYARHVYLPRDVQQNASFVDIVTVSPDGDRIIDLANFDKCIPIISDKQAREFL